LPIPATIIIYTTLNVGNGQILDKILTKKHLVQLYETHHKELFYYLSRLVSNHSAAEDLLHDTFERFIRYAAKNSIESTTVRAFLFKTAHNLAVNFLRSKARQSTGLDDTVNAQTSSLSPELSEKISYTELSKRIEQFINTLDPEGRSIFILHKEQNKTYDEISAEIGISSRTIRRRMKTIIETLEEILVSEGYMTLEGGKTEL
jgi:RNA polymerase sigma factor (sigma-70 family)